MRYKITLSYDGAKFFGWQSQPEAVTVQETLETALSTLAREKIAVTGAGRTDTNVNAVNYVAHFDTVKAIDAETFCYKLNAILPKSMAVQSICAVSENFHARFDATSREYTYFLHRRKDPFVENYSYFCAYALNFEAMNQAAALLLGKHDFACFEKTGADNRTSICTIYSAEWKRYTPTILQNGEDYWYFKVVADRFLRNMVRAIVGTLIDVGRGRRSVESIAHLLASGDRCLAGESVPGKALFLTKVEY